MYVSDLIPALQVDAMCIIETSADCMLVTRSRFPVQLIQDIPHSKQFLILIIVVSRPPP
jgi:hypothetical protein